METTPTPMTAKLTPTTNTATTAHVLHEDDGDDGNDEPSETTNRGWGRELTFLFSHTLCTTVVNSIMSQKTVTGFQQDTRIFNTTYVEQSRKFPGSATFPPIWESTDQPITLRY